MFRLDEDKKKEEEEEEDTFAEECEMESGESGDDDEDGYYLDKNLEEDINDVEVAMREIIGEVVDEVGQEQDEEDDGLSSSAEDGEGQELSECHRCGIVREVCEDCVGYRDNCSDCCTIHTVM